MRKTGKPFSKRVNRNIIKTIFVVIAVSTAYIFTTIVIFKETYLLFFTPVISISSIPFLNFLKKTMYVRNIDRYFLDFLLLLISVETVGLRLTDLFLRIAKGEMDAPQVYVDIARTYYNIEQLYGGNTHKALNTFLKILPRSKLKRFIEGYLGILETTGNTVNYTESYVSAELDRLEASLNGLVNIIENFYEAYLVILLSIIVISSLPVATYLQLLIYLIMFLIGIVGYVIAGIISKKIYLEEPFMFTVLVFAILSLVTFLLISDMFSTSIALSIVAIISGYILWRKYSEPRNNIEEHVYELTEDLYMEASQGFSIDTALMNLSGRVGEYSWIAQELSKLLRLGICGNDVLRILNLTSLLKKIMNMLLSPIEVSANTTKHIGYVLKFYRRIRSIRSNISDRIKTLYTYAFLLPPTMYSIAYGLKYMSIQSFLPIDPYMIPGYVFLASLSASFTANRIVKGSGVSDLKILVILLENILLYLWFTL